MNRLQVTIKLTILFVARFLFIPFWAWAQTDSLGIGTFRSHNPHDKRSAFLEPTTNLHREEGGKLYSITITVTNIRNQDGVIRFKFYDDSTPFPHDLGFLRIVVQKNEVKNGTFTATYFGFPPGYMAIALHDDENCNKKLDFSWFLPKEGYAFSDYYYPRLQRPDYSDFRFLLKENKVVVMRMKYH